MNLSHTVVGIQVTRREFEIPIFIAINPDISPWAMNEEEIGKASPEVMPLTISSLGLPQ